MPSERNTETRDAVKREIKEVQARCMHEWNVIENSPLDAPNVSTEEVNEKTLCYLEGLRTAVQNSNTPITADDNLLTSQFLKEINEKTVEVEEYTAYVRGSIQDMDSEINRLKTLITISQETQSRPQRNKREVRSEHIHKARERFQMMKNELQGLIHSLFPSSDSIIIEVMGQLMSENLNESSNGYIPVTPDTYQTIELLKDMKIVTTNPYNDMEVKLSY